MGEQRFALSASLLDAAFPFHIVFDRDLRITQAGTSIQRMHEDNMVGMPFNTLFDVATPKMARASTGSSVGRNRCSCSVR